MLRVEGNLLVFQLNGDITKIIGTDNSQIATGAYAHGRRSHTGDVIAVPSLKGYAYYFLTDDNSLPT